MLFELDNGKKSFYQWDLNQRVKVLDQNIKEVHFCCSRGADAMVVEVKDGYVDVPNILLQNAFHIFVYAFDGSATIGETSYDVLQRSKPSDYVYTETEVKSYEALSARIEALESAGSVDLGAIEDRIEALENKEVDLSDYYTKDEVVLFINDKIGVIENGSY